MRLKQFARYIWHDITAQKDYIGSYAIAGAVLLVAFFINLDHNAHKNSGEYWISPLESVFNTSFKNTDMTGAIMSFGILIALFLFVISVVIKRNKLDKIHTSNQLKLQEARDDLLALASHQLRTPATGVKQYLGIIREGMAGSISTKQRNLIDRAYFYNERQLRIINDFLYMAKLDAERIIVHPRDFDLVDLVKELVRIYEQNILAKELKVEISAPDDLIINADKQCVRMSIENLLSNAVKYTNFKGHVKIEVEKHTTTVSIRIIDNGVGIRKKDSSKLFKKFSRIDNHLSSIEGGSGIGLYIARKLVELNHGSIRHKSISGGSIFIIELPL